MKRLTKSQYELVADVITRCKGVLEPKERRLVASLFVAEFKETDTEFDETKFLILCGIEPEVELQTN